MVRLREHQVPFEFAQGRLSTAHSLPGGRLCFGRDDKRAEKF